MASRVEQMIDGALGMAPVYMEIMHRYDFLGEGVLLVVEGKDDAPFYERVARDNCEKRCEFSTVTAGEKSTVIELYETIDWCRYDKKRLLFFVDRDYTDYLNESQRISGDNVYVTDGYSIENSLLDVDTAISLSRRACTNNRQLLQEDEEAITKCYKESKREAARILLPLAAFQILSLRYGYRYNADDFNPERYLNASNGNISLRDVTEVGGADNIISMLLKSLPQASFTNDDVKEILSQIEESSSYEMVVRGKYRLRVFRMWLKSLEQIPLPSLATLKTGTITNSLIMHIMAVSPAPYSLRDFFNKNLSVQQ